MNAQHSAGWQASGVARSALSAGQAVRMHRGRLRVLDGVVWATRRGDPDDHLLERGEALEVGGEVLLESWGSQALIEWLPHPGLLQRGAEGVARGVLRLGAAGCAVAAASLGHASQALARRAGVEPCHDGSV